MRLTSRYLTLACLLIAFCARDSEALFANESISPNLVFICADQWRGQALGFLGKEKVLTPQLDPIPVTDWPASHWYWIKLLATIPYAVRIEPCL